VIGVEDQTEDVLFLVDVIVEIAHGQPRGFGDFRTVVLRVAFPNKQLGRLFRDQQLFVLHAFGFLIRLKTAGVLIFSAFPTGVSCRFSSGLVRYIHDDPSKTASRSNRVLLSSLSK
jgi:hypothetical protein